MSTNFVIKLNLLLKMISLDILLGRETTRGYLLYLLYFDYINVDIIGG